MSYFNEPEQPGCCEECGYAMQDCCDGCDNCTTTCQTGIAKCLINCCSYGTPAPMDSGSEVLPPWRKLWVEFVNRCSWHGLKYTELRSRFIIRRFVWTAVLLCTVTLFLYINSTKLIYLLTHPVTINLNVLYNNSLPFPAVTICNPNQFRLTALQEMGLLDLMTNDLDSSSCSACQEYVLYSDLCWSKTVDSPEFFKFSFTEVSRQVCMSLCSETFDSKCSGFFYYRFNRTCLLSSYTGEWVDVGDLPCPPYSGAEFYKRNRKLVYDSIVCTFEESSCLFVNEVDKSDSWILGEAKNSPVASDNTLDLGSGHIMSLLATEQKPTFTAELSSPYMDTSGMCLELFYWLQSDKANLGVVPTLSIVAVDEEKVRTSVNTTKRLIKDWSRFFVALPRGINQIVIQGTRAEMGINGIAIDDISVRKCDQFNTNKNCKVSHKGIAYMGNINVSSSGQPCVRWDQVRSSLVYKLPDQFAKDAVNYCRYIPQENWEEPSCFVRNGDSVEISPCSVPYCRCSDNSSFTCDKGLCLPSNLLCNGIQDCTDGTDEVEACAGLMSTDCSFNDDFICGYKRNKVGSLSWERVASSSLMSYSSTSIYHNVSTLAYMMFVDSQYGQVGDQVQLISPRTNFSRPTLISFDSIMASTSDVTDNGLSGLYLYQLSSLHTPLQLLFKKTNFYDTTFTSHSVCVPQGSYYLMFLGVQGRLYEQAIGLPAVRILGDCIGSTVVNNDITYSSTNLNCTFFTMCGYSFLSSSAYLNYSFDYTEGILSTFSNGPACSNTFNGVDGVILSPGYPNRYPNNLLCDFEIVEPEGSAITVTFVEFSIEAESDCLFDRLEVFDPIKSITRFFCGSTIPPPIKSQGNRLRFSFRSDNSENIGKFKITYLATSNTGTDLSLVYKYIGPSLLHGYSHVGRLMSSVVSLPVKSCLIAEVIVLSKFKVIIGYEDHRTGDFTETTIFSISRSLGKEWHKLFLDLDPSILKDGRVVVMFEVSIDYTSTLEPAAVKQISISNKLCKDTVYNPTLACNFKDIKQCGYLDASTGNVHWTRVYNENSRLYYMSVYYDVSYKDPATLRSGMISVDSRKCLNIYYDTSDSSFEMEIASSLASSTSFRYKLITDDSANIQYNIQQGTQEISIKVYPLSSSSGNIRMEASEINIQNIAMLDGACQTLERQADINCDFDNLFICNFKASTLYGGAWQWTPYDVIVTYGPKTGTTPSKKPHVDSPVPHGSVMMYNQTTNNILGILSSPAIFTNNTLTITFEALTSNRNLTTLQVHYGTSLGQLVGKLMDIKFDNDLTWKNYSICLPAKHTHLFFVASVSSKHFVLIDGIYSSPGSCSPVVADPNAVCQSTGESIDCPNSFFTWSSNFNWITTSSVQKNFDPEFDGCMYVYDRSEGTFKFHRSGKMESNMTECDVYIRGRGRMIVTVWFTQFVATDCTTQFVEIWEHRSNSAPWLSTKICTNDTSPSYNFTVDDIVQVHVTSKKNYPQFVMKYSYSLVPSSAYSSGLYYTPGLAASEVRGVATWTSPVRILSKNVACLRMDTTLPQSNVDVYVFYQYGGANIRQMAVYSATKFNKVQRDWSNGTFQVSFDPPSSNSNSRLTVQFLFIFSLALDAPINSSFFGSDLISAMTNVRLSDSKCLPANAAVSRSPPICLLDSKDFCGFTDESTGSSRWVRVSLRSNFVRSGDCRTKEDGSMYTGETSKTISGRTCQRWDSQSPQKHYQDVSEYFPDASIFAVANKCRNPNNPFIPRSCWCYTNDAEQRREYCDIPLCTDKYFQAEFSSSMFSSTLVSSPFTITTPYCFAFQYIITSPFIQLEVYSVDTSGNESILQVFSLTDRSMVTQTVAQSTAPIGYVTLSPGIWKIKFVTKKLDNQAKIYILISNMTSYIGACSSVAPANVVTPVNRIPYNGSITNRTDFKNQIFKYDLKDWNILNLTEILAHQKHDLIHKCSYDSSECNDRDIITKQTDIGQCYTFNKEAFRVSTSSGLEYGAKFILNIEQYEYVPGYVSGEGVKLQLHDHDDIPSMKDLSVAVLPGVHNLGIATYSKTENLEAPYGKCGMFPLDYYALYNGEPYTEARCKLEKKTKRVERICGCAEAYMPGFSRFCNLNETLTCSTKIVGRALTSQCPTPCLLNSYAIQISQIGLSGLSMSDLLNNKSAEVEKKYLTALDLKHRVGREMTNLLQFLEVFLLKLNEFKDHVYFSILDSQTSTLNRLESSIKTLIDLSSNDVVAVGNQLLSDMEDTYTKVGSSRLVYLKEYLDEAHSSLAYYKDLSYEADRLNGNNSGSIHETRYWYLHSVNRTIVSLNNLDGVLSTYKFVSGVNNEVDDKVQCKDANNASLIKVCECNIKVLLSSIRVVTSLMGQALNIIIANADVTNAWTTEVPQSTIKDLVNKLKDATECTSQLKTSLDGLTSWLVTSVDSFSLNLRNVSLSINPQTPLITIDSVRCWIKALENNYSLSIISKKQLAQVLLGSEVDEALRNLANIVLDITQNVLSPIQDNIFTAENLIKTNYQTFLMHCQRLYNITQDEQIEAVARKLIIWKKPIANLDIPKDVTFTLKSEETWQVWPKEQILTDFYPDGSNTRLTFILDKYFDVLKNEMQDLTSQLNSFHDKVKASMADIETELRNYLKSTELNEDFLRTNFLMLDIFYGDMKYQDIVMKSAYGWIDFFSNVGGYFGLLMGCSVITMCEVADFFVYHSSVKLYEKIEQSRRKRRHVIHVDVKDDYYPNKGVRFSDHKLDGIKEESNDSPLKERKFKNPLNFDL